MTEIKYPIPERWLMAGTEEQDQADTVLSGQTRRLLESKMSLPEYQKAFASTSGSFGQHFRNFEDIIRGDFPHVFLLDLLDSYPEGPLIYKQLSMEGPGGQTDRAYFAEIIATLPEESQWQLTTKFGLDLAADLTNAKLLRAAQDVVDGKLGWPALFELFRTSPTNLANHREAFKIIADQLNNLTPEEQINAVAGLLADYEHGLELLNDWNTRGGGVGLVLAHPTAPPGARR